eukprot:12575553-Alexandrium_andersonii.AAC.1
MSASLVGSEMCIRDRLQPASTSFNQLQPASTNQLQAASYVSSPGVGSNPPRPKSTSGACA